MWKSVEGIDWKLLQEQKLNLIESTWEHKKLTYDTVEGILNLLDSLLDEAEEKGLFKYTETEEDE